MTTYTSSRLQHIFSQHIHYRGIWIPRIEYYRMVAYDKRQVRNERARSKTALKSVLKPLPKEIEDIIMEYLNQYHLPSCKRNGKARIDISMKWQKHPNADIINSLQNQLECIRCHSLYRNGVYYWGAQNHFHRYLSLIVNEYLTDDARDLYNYIESYYRDLIRLIWRLKDLPFIVKINLYNLITDKLDELEWEDDTLKYIREYEFTNPPMRLVEFDWNID